ncbi:MAG: DUF1302 family protein [Pseudomonadota bacterium]
MKRPVVLILAATIGTISALQVRAADSGTDGHAVADSLSSFLQEQRVSGVLRTDYFGASKTLDGEKDLLGATAQIKAQPRFAENLDGKLELRVSDPGIGKGASTKNQLLEGYLNAHFEKADLRVGKQIIAWGRADGINPTDNLTPRNYAAMLPFEDDQRFGTTAVKLDYYLSQAYTVTAFVTPFFEPSKIPLPTARGYTFIETKPHATLSNTELGLKLNQVSDGLDWSVSAFHGFSLLPQMQLVASGPATSVVELSYDRITVFGADFARSYGRYGLRGEVAYGHPDDTRGAESGAMKPYLSWVAGVDRTFFENLNVNLQFFQRRVRGYREQDLITSPAQRSIAIQSVLLNGQRDRINNGISFRVSNKWLNDSLEFEVFSVLNLTRSNRLIRPLLTYAFNDHWKGTIGAEYYSGADDTQFGSLKASRGAFAELRYGF